ncbi:ABC transporter ATP-binding protein [Acidithiobacillus sp. AMEEHan]|uniref:ABC transporter ATP-binding protein n=1 Tax=Acidithiobacillus sp. AMEEHan TaxID=2994951 RepID=UPI0027E4D9ED|nr:ABC transporter ATP-binding protein [Acidithiobacillus sp. AMEEHan]
MKGQRRSWLRSANFRRFLQFFQPYRGAIATALFFMTLSGLASGASAYVVKPILDHIFIDRQAGMLLWLPLLVIAIYAIKGFSDYSGGVILARMEEKILRQLREQLYAHTLRLPLPTLLQQSQGSTLSRMSLDLTLLQQSLSVLARFFLSGVQILALIGVAFYMSWSLALICLGTLPLAFYPLIRFGQSLRRRGHEQQEQMGDILGQFAESLRGVEVIKSQGTEDFEARRFAGLAQTYYHLMMRIVRIQKASTPVMELIAALGIAVTIYLGGHQVVNGAMTTGAFFAFLTALAMVYEPLRQLSSANNQLQQGLSAADRLFHWLDQEAETASATAEAPQTSPGSWRCRGLRLRYAGDMVLQDIDIAILPGSFTAIAGASGSGKTSLLRVILGLLPPDSGEISIGERSTKELSLRSYRQHFSYVAQEPLLFSGTVWENIAYADPEPDRKRAEDAARAAHCWEFLQDAGGLDAAVQGHGSNFSGGQRQRLAIARALYQRRPFLVLDEATSALDSESEQHILDTLAELRGKITIIVAAHREASLTLADQVIRLERGRILSGARASAESSAAST